MPVEDPLLDPDYRYSLNRFEGNGATTSWNLTFAGGFIDREHVRAYLENEDGSLSALGFAWISDTVVDVTPAVVLGQSFVFYRDTPKNAPLVDFNGGSAFTETNLDTLSKQAVFIGAETIDRFAGVEERTTAATTAAALATATANSALAEAGVALDTAETAIANATAANDTAIATAGQFDALATTVEDLLGEDLSGLARLDATQFFTARQDFRGGWGAFNAGGTLGSELLSDGRYRLYAGGAWGSPRSFHDWNLLTNKPGTFTPSAHTQGWDTITDKPTTFPATTHTHAYSSLTGIPASFPPATHSHEWADIVPGPNIRNQIVSTSAPSGGVDGDVWLRYVP